MLKLISGPFHPYLEDALLNELSPKISSNLVLPKLIITPSGRLMERLQSQVTDRGWAVINVHFHTFTSLADLIVSEAGGLKKAVLSDPLFFDTVTKIIVKEDRPFPGLEDLAVPQGFPPQVRGTLRDLVDAGIPSDGSLLSAAVRENFLGQNVDMGWLLQLLQLYRKYVERVSGLKEISPRSDLLLKAIEESSQSTFLSKFEKILFYGFYDLTGLQTQFFENIVKTFPSTLYFPYLPDHKAYSFSSIFRDNILMPLIKDELSYDGEVEDNIFPLRAPRVEIFNTSGLRDEAWHIANQIIQLNEENHIPFSDMAVITRSQERIKKYLLTVFEERGIPFSSSAKENLSSCPQVDLALQFLSFTDPNKDINLPKDFVLSPDYRRQKDIHNFNISKELPGKGSWGLYVEKVKNLLDDYFKPSNIASQKTWDMMKAGLLKLEKFDVIKSPVLRAEFLEVLEDRWLKTEYTTRQNISGGVQLLHAEAARGLEFKVVFLLGVEERVFPRIIREDPFLRDDARGALFNTLGFKINRKMAGIDEEKLLFHLVTYAAIEKLVLTYQRSDDEGKIVGPSTYLRELAEKNKIDLETAIESIPRSYSEKLRNVNPNFIGAKDIIAGFLVSGCESEALSFVKKIKGDHISLKKGLCWVKKIESWGEPGEQDGCLKSMDLMEAFPKGRIAATKLETFGACPFQFFAQNVLHLKQIEEEAVGTRLPPDKKGSLIHSFFEFFYKNIHWIEVKNNKIPMSLFNATFKDVFESVLADELKIHSIFWDASKELIKADLLQFLKIDLERIEKTGSKPTYFEEEFESTLEAPLNQINWFAKPDRVDVGPNSATIVDYKTGRITPHPLLDSLRGLKIQPALYMMLMEKFLKTQDVEISEINFMYQRLSSEFDTSHLTFDQWFTYKDQIVDTIHEQVEMIKSGTFIIYPDDEHKDKYCNWCEVNSICRKNHAPSLYRAGQGPGLKFEKLRSRKPPPKGGKKK